MYRPKTFMKSRWSIIQYIKYYSSSKTATDNVYRTKLTVVLGCMKWSSSMTVSACNIIQFD